MDTNYSRGVEMHIKGCTAVITGGASGLGEASVYKLAEAGANVAILDLNDELGEKLASTIGNAAIFCKTNVADEESVSRSINKAAETFGGIHVAINCAGIGGPAKVISKKGLLPMEKFNRILQVNLVGTLHVIRLAAEKMMANTPNDDGEKGVIINTASIAAYEGQIGQVCYAASKAGVVGMTLPIAREFADYGIRVVTIAPGLFETPMLAKLPDKARASLISTIPFPKRLGKPPEYAALAAHIIENAMLNGETIRLDSSIRMAPR